MGSLTPKGFYKASPDDIVDANVSFVDNFNLVDSRISFIPCLSTDRPNPYEGMKIWETDTDQLYIYARGIWTLMVDVPPVVSAGGRKAFVKEYTNGNSLANTEADLTLKTTFTAQTGRRYWVESSFEIENISEEPVTLNLNLRWASGTTVSNSSTSINGTRPCEVFSSFAFDSVYFIHEFVPNINGSVTVGWFGRALTSGINFRRYTQGAGNDNGVSTLLVRDVGSST